MFWLHLLRVRCEQLPQGDLFEKVREPSAVIVDAIKATPTADVGRGSEWHIGKPEPIDDAGVGFKMGRTTAMTVPQYDSERHDFFEREVERAPYTFGIYDIASQSCGIIKKAGVSQNASEISKKLEILLNSTSFPLQSGYKIVVDTVTDPDGFIDQLKDADSISRFSFSASFPNPHDVEALIQRPAEEFTKAVGGQMTKVEVQGESLDPGVLEDLARAVASTGDQASATVRVPGQRRGKRIYLRGNPVQEPVEEQQSTKGLYGAMWEATRKAYNRVRNVVR